VAIFISLFFLVIDTFVRPYQDFRCNALKVLTSMSMLITLVCGLASKLDWRREVVNDSTLGWTLVVSNFIIVLLVLSLELIRRMLSFYSGIRSGIAFIQNTAMVCPLTSIQTYSGEFRRSAEDEPIEVDVKAYPLHTYPDARLVHAKVQALGNAPNICQIYQTEVEDGVLYAATPPLQATLGQHIDQFGTCPTTAPEFCSALITALERLHKEHITHGALHPEHILLDGCSVQIANFSRAKAFESDATANTDSIIDKHMLACTILYTLSGGVDAQDSPMDFDELMEATGSGFGADELYDTIKAGKHELKDLLCSMVRVDSSFEELLNRCGIVLHNLIEVSVFMAVTPSACKRS
jgi:serine/threonine protein kinase